MDTGSQKAPAKAGLLRELWEKKSYILKAFLAIAAFWLIEFAFQYYGDTNGILETSLTRSFALGGATLIGIALAIGPIAVLFPKHNLVVYRRTIGAGGFFLIILHSLSVFNFVFKWDLGKLFWNTNPFINVMLLGFGAYLLFLPMFITSTDWAVRKLTFRNWKAVHRLVYFAYLLAVMHFTLINPNLINKPMGIVLLVVTVIALLLQLAAFIKRIRMQPRLGLGAWVGFGIILLYLALLSAAYFFRNALIGK